MSLHALNRAAAGVSARPPGQTFARMALAQHWGSGDAETARAAAEAAWGSTSIPARILRSPVGAMNTTDSGALAEYATASAEFIAGVRPLSILGKMSGYMTAPFRVKIPRVTAGATVGWVGPGGPAPLSALALDTVTMENHKLSGILVVTKELADLSTPAAEGVVRAELLAATAALTDRTFVDPAWAGETGVSPRSVSYGASSIASTGSTAAAAKTDLRALIRLLLDAGINLQSPYFVMDRPTASALATMDDGGSFFSKVTVNGGMLAGIPVVTSSSVPADTDSPSNSNIILLDAAEILVADSDEATVSLSTQTSLEFSSSPSSPPVAGTVMVNLWQSNLVAWRVTRSISWQLRRPGAVAVLTGVSY